MSKSGQVNTEALNLIISMGFPESQARIALLRTNNDIEHAVDMLSNGLREEDDAEFDLISAAGPEPDIRPPTVFKPRSTHDEAHNDSFANVIGGTIPEMVDARISTFTEMGFTAQQAEEALRQTNGDVNEALNLLLST
jgi:uncharacterized UBP type Zn finger protein